MSLLCEDADLLAVEPGVFTAPAFVGQKLLSDVSAVVSGTTVTISGASFATAGVAAGMVATLSTLDEVTVGAWEIVAVNSGTTATLSVPRAYRDDAAAPPGVSGSLRLTVVSYRPQIMAVSAELLAGLGVNASRDGADRAYEAGVLCRSAAVVGALAAVYAAMAPAELSIQQRSVKRDHYQAAFKALRQAMVARVDMDGDGTVETTVHRGVRTLTRV